VAALAGAGAVGITGGIVGALVGLGIPEYEAKRYEGRVKHGGILLSVHCDDSHWVKRAEEVLKQTGAEDISSSGESAADFAVSDKPMLRNRSSIVDDPADPAVTRPVVTNPVNTSPVVTTPVDEPVIVRTTGTGTTWEP
jgi:hypothetical protein